MKLDARRAAAFLRSPEPDLPIVLLYGSDPGLVTERAEQLGRLVVADLTDPFRVSELQGEQLRFAPERLAEEALAMSLVGGRRLVRVRQAGDDSRRALELLLEAPPPESLVLLEAGELGTASKLRQLAERAKPVAVIGCWREAADRLPQTLRAMLDELGLKAIPEALDHLSASLGADRGASRRELEKLALYKLDRPGPVTLAEAQACVGDAFAVALDDVVYAALLGQIDALGRTLERLLGEGIPPQRVVRTMSGILLTLLRLQAQAEAGEPIERLVAKPAARIHFSARPRASTVLRRHPPERLLAWLGQAQAAELQSRTTGAPDALICRQLLLELCLEARPPKGGAARRRVAALP